MAAEKEREKQMATFIVLSRLTDEGVKNIGNVAERMAANRENGEKLGLTVKGWYMTQGQYDLVVIVEAPDAETMMKQNFFVGGRGFSRSETLRAFSLEEIQQITGS